MSKGPGKEEGKSERQSEYEEYLRISELFDCGQRSEGLAALEELSLPSEEALGAKIAELREQLGAVHIRGEIVYRNDM